MRKLEEASLEEIAQELERRHLDESDPHVEFVLIWRERCEDGREMVTVTAAGDPEEIQDTLERCVQEVEEQSGSGVVGPEPSEN